jgi:hypothetical protein
MEFVDMKTVNEMALEAWGAGHEIFWFDDDGIERFAALVAAAEREAIYDEWHSCVMSDLENGVKCLNEKAAADWHKNYPAQSKMFPEWIEARGQA